MKIATIAFLSLTSLVAALPNTPAGYGTTTLTKKTWTSTTTKLTTTSCTPVLTTEHSTGYTTVPTYKDVTKWITTTIKSDVPKTYITKSCSKDTGAKTETKSVTKPYTDVSTAYSISLSTKTETVTKGRESNQALSLTSRLILIARCRDPKSDCHHHHNLGGRCSNQDHGAHRLLTIRDHKDRRLHYRYNHHQAQPRIDLRYGDQDKDRSLERRHQHSRGHLISLQRHQALHHRYRQDCELLQPWRLRLVDVLTGRSLEAQHQLRAYGTSTTTWACDAHHDEQK
jgi:hypothetical protein